MYTTSIEHRYLYVAAADSESDKRRSSVASEVLTAVPQTELYAVLDTGQTKRPKTPLPVSGPDLAARLNIGTRVVRGTDWKWGDQVELTADVFMYFCLPPLSPPHPPLRCI